MIAQGHSLTQNEGPFNWERNSIMSTSIRRIGNFEIRLSLFILTAALSQICGRTGVLSSNLQASMGTDALEGGYSEARALVLGESIAQAVEGSKTYSYKITLESEQYLRVLIIQSDIEVGMTLFAPDGQSLSRVICRENRPTPISAIANVSGTYRIEFRSLEKDPSQGHFKVRVEEIRPATVQDNHRIDGERAYARAEELRYEWRVESCRQAIKKYEEGLQHWRAVGEEGQEAVALRNIGAIHLLLGEPRTSLKLYQQALVLSKKANDFKCEVETLNGIADVYLHLGDNQKAMESCSKALNLSRANDDTQGEAQALTDIAKVQYEGSGELRRSLEYFDHALALWCSLGNRRGQAEVLFYSGLIYSDLGEAQKAATSYNQALSLWRSLHDRRGEALTLIAIGHLHSRLGDKQEAIDLLNRALELVRPMGDKVWEASILAKLGWTLYTLGEKQRSLDYYKDGLRLFQAVNFRVGEAGVLMEMGWIYNSSGQNRRALDHYNRALLLSRSLADRQIESYVLRDMGVVYESLGQKAEALRYYKQALSLSRACGERRAEAYTLNNLGRLYEDLGRASESVDNFHRALSLSRETQDHIAEALSLCNIARAERTRGHLTEARLQLEEAIKIIESLRIKVASQELRSSYFASEHQRFDFYIDLLMQMHQQRPSEGIVADALQASERARARSLLESLTEAQAKIRQGIDPTLLDRELQLQQSLSAKAERQTRVLDSKPDDKKEAQALAKEIRDLANEYDQVQAEIKSKSPRYAALTQPQPLTLREIQQQVLDDNSLLLEYALGDEHSYLWAVTQTTIKSYELPKRVEIERATRRVYDLLTSRQPKERETARQYQARVSEADAKYWREAMALSELLLGPAAEQLGTKRLLIVAEGALEYLPFGALPMPKSQGGEKENRKTAGKSPDHSVPLIIEHEIVNLPSASTLAILRRETRDRPAPAKMVAVLADPVFTADDPRVQGKVPNEMKRNKVNSFASSSSLVPISSDSLVSTSPHSQGTDSPAPASDLHRAFRDAGILRGGGLDISRLFFSRQEAEAILAVTPQGGNMKALDFEASRATATSPELSQYRIVHFATHGLLNSEHPELSGLVLSLVDEHGQSQDGFLRLHDIYNLNLPADLVVLSACSTGLGKEIRGEGLVGIVRGFMYAGATRVVASLWKVDDESTAELMKRFYQQMLQGGMSPAAALRAAQVDLQRQKRWASPFYWAAFVLQGEWR